ncbi:stage II sporulation protein M [Tumebacillus permanentifrigoris]|uniref:Stage II sporulation protein M n=1 Tax=Tumebacillus permanentifrigoris TaxID=378543 RepID=A0A316DB12_9BACL|nr:stage II sporulation protein M [Tumebacillus permanentifrigoris]PWK14518.1 stage II sporulation protein M [Tumebacillus permanentifrigoris]
MSQVKLNVSRYLQDQSSLFVFTTVLFFIGILFGAIVVSALSADQATSLHDALHGFFKALNLDETGTTPSEITWHSVASFLKTTGLMWILGLSIIGLPVIVILIFMKGFVIGFTVGVIVSQFQAKGVLFALAAILPQNLIYVPALIICGVAGISFSLSLVRSRFSNSQPRTVGGGSMLYRSFLSYTGLVTCIAVAMILAAFVEGYVSPALMRAVIPQL